MRAEVGAAAGEGDAADGGGADEAGLAGAPVDLVPELEEAAGALGIDVVGDGGAAKPDGVAEDLDERGAQAGQFGAGEAGGLAGGAKAGAEEGFVGVDVADAVQERLVEQRGLDRRAARMEEGDEVCERDGEGFAAGAGVGCWLLVVGGGVWREMRPKRRGSTKRISRVAVSPGASIPRGAPLPLGAPLRVRTAWVWGASGISGAQTSRRPVMPRWMRSSIEALFR